MREEAAAGGDDGSPPFPRTFHYDAYSTTRLNLRAAPSPDAPLVGQLSAGDEVMERGVRSCVMCDVV